MLVRSSGSLSASLATQPTLKVSPLLKGISVCMLDDLQKAGVDLGLHPLGEVVNLAWLAGPEPDLVVRFEEVPAGGEELDGLRGSRLGDSFSLERGNFGFAG
jgi:hypothetical protein